MGARYYIKAGTRTSATLNMELFIVQYVIRNCLHNSLIYTKCVRSKITSDFLEIYDNMWQELWYGICFTLIIIPGKEQKCKNCNDISNDNMCNIDMWQVLCYEICCTHIIIHGKKQRCK